MRKILLFLLIFLSFRVIHAQDSEEVGIVSRFGIAGGFNPAYVFPDLKSLNTEIRNFGLSELNDGMMLWGGGGYAYIMFVNNLRIGGIGLGGKSSTTGIVDGYNREVDYNFGMGGVTVEYTLPFINRVALSVGTIIGVGTQSIEVYQNKGDYTWPGFWDEFKTDGSDDSGNESHIARNTFFTITPTLNLDIPVTRFISVRIGGGYILNFNSSWNADNGKNVSITPGGLTSNNFFLQTGVYFGFFAF